MHKWTLTGVGLLALFLALQFLIPARLVIGGMGAVGRPSVAVGLMLLFLWFVSAIRRKQLPAGRQPIHWVVGIFVGLQLLGYAVGYDRLPSPEQASSADRWLIFTLAIAGVLLFVADGIRTRAELDRTLGLLVFFTAIMAIIGVLQFTGIVDVTQYINIPGLSRNSELIGISERGSGGFPRVASTANHFIEFGVVLALVLPIAMHYALFAPRGRVRVWRWIGVALIATGIPLSISRSAILTVFVTMAMMAIVWPWRQRYNALVISIVSILVFHVINRGVLGTIRSLFTNAENDSSVTDRIARTGTVLELWSQRPWLGWGAGMVTPEEFLLLDNQIYVTLIAGGVAGVIGLLLFFLVPYLVARSVRLRGKDQETRHLGHALAVTMPAAVLASGTFDSFAFATFVGVMCILVGAIGALWRLDGTSVHTPIQVSAPGDKFVTTPLMANLRARLRDAWVSTTPRNYGRRARSAAETDTGA
ncbi:O-antigen ligase family protein [Pseudactinotalea terrae]|uniref:O-antigen ligase family protein n=1 Tax=Pseudactinotalea terrae TaxID=1743262 RepID=UPI0012E154B6|nr:O-antigen ligase family protein [Pseudactinotalea terrae]